jgi:hypothetical protein
MSSSSTDSLNPQVNLWENPQVAPCSYGIGVSGFDLIGRHKIQIREPSQPSFVSANYFTTPTLEEANGEKPLNNPKTVHVTVVTDFRQTLQLETGYGETNAWLKWIKCSVHALNRISYYACTAGRPKTQVVSFSLGLPSDPNDMACMTTLYQEDSDWGNESCKTSSLLFPAVKVPSPLEPSGPAPLTSTTSHASLGLGSY